MKELDFPQRFLTRDTIPRTWEEKIVSFSDIAGRVVGMEERDIWADPKAAGNAVFKTVNGWYEKYAGHSMTTGHPHNTEDKYTSRNQEIFKTNRL
jgi:hypothetical protein